MLSLFKKQTLCLAISLACLSACGQAPESASTFSEPAVEAAAYAPATADETMQPLSANTEQYGKIDTNPVQAVAQQPVSTFSIVLDTCSNDNKKQYVIEDS